MWFFRGIFGSIKNNAQCDMGTFPVFIKSQGNHQLQSRQSWRHRDIAQFRNCIKTWKCNNIQIVALFVHLHQDLRHILSWVGLQFWAGKISNYMIWFSEIVVSWKSEQYLITVVFAIYFDNLINDSETFHFPKISAYRIRF